MMNLKPPVFKSVNKCGLLYVSSSVMLSIILHQGHVRLVGHGWYTWGDKGWDCCIATTLPNLTRSGAISHHLMSSIPYAPLWSVPIFCILRYSDNLLNIWGGWGCEVSCGGHHRLRGKTTMGSALAGAVFDIAQILAYLVHNMSRSQLYLGFGHFCWLLSFFGQ